MADGLLLGMGNPLLDISNDVEAWVLEKYGLDAGTAILAEEKHQPIFEELKAQAGTKYIAGGATQNTIRVAQWMLQRPGATAYMGCVGTDENAGVLKKACEQDGVTCAYMEDAATPTGTCACLIVGKERTLVTNLGAANNYKVEHLTNPARMAILQEAKVVYSAGFFMTVSPESMKLASEHCQETGKTYCLNLSAPFLMEVPPFKAVLMETMPNVDILFGNETEAAVFAKTEGWTETEIPAIAQKMAALPKNGKPRTVVITQGKEPTVVVSGGEVKTYPIIELPAEKVVDTNGAGDSYVGGFLSGFLQGKDMAACCAAGAYAASVVVQRSGCTYPEKPDF